jgi:hypothetical protein
MGVSVQLGGRSGSQVVCEPVKEDLLAGEW